MVDSDGARGPAVQPAPWRRIALWASIGVVCVFAGIIYFGGAPRPGGVPGHYSGIQHPDATAAIEHDGGARRPLESEMRAIPDTEPPGFLGGVAGRVVDSLMQPVSGADVLAWPYGTEPLREPEARTKSGIDGTFEMQRLRSVRVLVKVSSPEFAPTLRGPFSLGGLALTPTGDIKLSKPSRLVVDVRGTHGEPIASARVSVDLCSTNTVSERPTIIGQSNASGSAVFTALPAGLHGVRVEKAGHGTAYIEVDVASGQSKNVEALLVPLEGDFPQDGVVLDDSGCGVAGAKVIVESKYGVLETECDHDGKFLLFLPLKARSTSQLVSVDAGSVGTAEAVLRPKDTQWVLHLGQRQPIHGKVTDASSGNPLDGVHLFTDAFFQVSDVSGSSAVSDASGFFSLMAVKRGGAFVPLIVRASFQGYQPYARKLDRADLSDGKPIQIALEPFTKQLSGKVVDDRGHPVASAIIEVVHPVQIMADGRTQLSRSGPDGRFTLPVSSHFYMEVTVSAPDHSSRTFEVSESLTTGDMDMGRLVIPRAALSILRVSDWSGAPIAGAFFNPVLTAGSNQDLVILPTDGSGECTVALPLGETPALLYRPGFAPTKVRLDGRRPEQDFILFPGARITARIDQEEEAGMWQVQIEPSKEPEGSTPYCWAFVGHRVVSGPFGQVYRPNSSGVVEIGDLPTGSFILVSSTDKGEEWRTAVTIAHPGVIVDLGVLRFNEQVGDGRDD